MRKAGDEEIQKALTGGIVFKKVSERLESSGVKTKAKKKQYITGAHGSAAAKKKERIRKNRANRHRGKS